MGLLHAIVVNIDMALVQICSFEVPLGTNALNRPIVVVKEIARLDDESAVPTSAKAKRACYV